MLIEYSQENIHALSSLHGTRCLSIPKIPTASFLQHLEMSWPLLVPRSDKPCLYYYQVPDALEHELKLIGSTDPWHNHLTFVQRFEILLSQAHLKQSTWARNNHIDRRYMHKLKHQHMGFSKRFILKVALSFKLSLVETNQLLASEGYTLSSAQPSDIIIAYYIKRRIYNLAIINEALYHFKQKLL